MKNYRDKRSGSGTSEAAFTTRLATALRARGALTFKIHGHLLQAGGWPDTYVAHPMWRGWIESKVDSNNLDARQRAIGKQLKRAGDRFVVARFCRESEVVQFEDEEEDLLSILPFSKLDDGQAVIDALRKAANL